jgi:hypothetical protein
MLKTIKIKTSGCPKNQKRCWNKTGSPPPAGSKNEVLKFLSVSNILIAPANTGSVISRRIAVTNIAQQNNDILCSNIPSVLMLSAVLIKLIAPNKEDTPARCSEKIAKSTDPPECDCIPDKGGYHN